MKFVFLFLSVSTFCFAYAPKQRPKILTRIFPWESSYKLDLISRGSVHTNTPHDLASAKQILEFEQTVKFSPYLNFVGGFRFYADGSFATNTRYASPVRENESIDLGLRDLYLQYRQGPWLVKVGNQQAVWGEAFGFYYADIVNPKDMREFGLGDLSYYRLPVGMLNANLFLNQTTLQLIWIPKPYFNQMPSVGNDFAFPFERFFPGANVTLQADRTKPWALTSSEVGLRVNQVFHGWDLGVFVFNYFSRSPNYTVSGLTFTESHSRLTSLGFTGSKEWGEWVSRFEVVGNFDKPVDTFSGIYQTQKAFEGVGVIGIDYTGSQKWRVGAQLSDRQIFNPPRGTVLASDISLISVNLGGNHWLEHSTDLILSYCFQDGSSLVQWTYQLPISQQLEFGAGANLLFGSSNSVFGLYQNASRFFIQLRGYLGQG